MPHSGKRNFGYDLIKTIAIFMIVFYHLGGVNYGNFEQGTCYLPNFNKILLSFCASSVPLFLMVNGALILPKQYNFHESLVKAMQMFLLFLFGKVVLQKLISESLFSIQEEMVHFWFLGTLAIVYIFSFFLNQAKWLRTIILLLLFIYPFISNFLFDISTLLSLNSYFFFLRHDGFFTLYALIYFYLGYYLNGFRINSIYTYLMILVGILFINIETIILSNYYQISFDGVNGSFPTIGALFLSTGFFILIKDTVSCNEILQKTITLIGRNTMSIYLFHVIFIFLLRKYTQFAIDGISLLASILLSCSIIIIIAFISYSIKNICKLIVINMQKYN